MQVLHEKTDETESPVLNQLRKDRHGTEAVDSSLSRYLLEIQRIPMLDLASESEVAVRARSGDANARNLLVMANLRFVVAVARKY